eukprot:s3640_g1.t1
MYSSKEEDREAERLPGGSLEQSEILRALAHLYELGGGGLAPNPRLAWQFQVLSNNRARLESKPRLPEQAGPSLVQAERQLRRGRIWQCLRKVLGTQRLQPTQGSCSDVGKSKEVHQAAPRVTMRVIQPAVYVPVQARAVPQVVYPMSRETSFLGYHPMAYPVYVNNRVLAPRVIVRA